MTQNQLTEKQFQAQVIELARYCGWLLYHTYDSRRSTPGFPDLVLARDNRIIFAELKTEKGRISAAQKEWAEKLTKTPAEYYLWRPSDWESIEKILARDTKEKWVRYRVTEGKKYTDYLVSQDAIDGKKPLTADQREKLDDILHDGELLPNPLQKTP